MPDSRYCYPDSDVLVNKLNIRDKDDLFTAEVELTSIRLNELQNAPIEGSFDFNHLKNIHKYIFQDIYDWAGKERTVEIGKGNLFCLVSCINEYAQSVFKKYYPQCYDAKDDFDLFIKTFADNYGDLNALHPFREGNGRTQREFARLICLKCGYDFDLSCTTHNQMLEASKCSFNTGDNAGFIEIFSKAVKKQCDSNDDVNRLKILTMDDLIIDKDNDYDYYDYVDNHQVDVYEELYRTKIKKMYSEISDLENIISSKKVTRE